MADCIRAVVSKLSQQELPHSFKLDPKHLALASGLHTALGKPSQLVLCGAPVDWFSKLNISVFHLQAQLPSSQSWPEVLIADTLGLSFVSMAHVHPGEAGFFRLLARSDFAPVVRTR